jgi:hypothetical protein
VAYLSTPQPFNDAVRRFLDEVDRARVSSGDAAAQIPAGTAPSASG